MQFNKYKVSSDLAERIKSAGEKRRLTENERNQLEERLTKIINQPFVSFGGKSKSNKLKLVGVSLFAVVFIAPPIVLFICGLKVAAAIVAALVAALFVYVFIADRNIKRTSLNMLGALKNNSYDAYRFNAPEKLWCSDHLSTGAEEQDYATIDDEGNLYDFYIDCGGIVLSVEENEYNAATDEVLIVLFSLGKKTVLEYFVPDRNQ